MPDNFSVTGSRPVTGTAVTIVPRLPTENYAPYQAWFEATDILGLEPPSLTGPSYIPEFAEYHYVWTVRGEPLPAWTAPENMIPAWNNPNVYFGKHVGMCIEVPGDYIIDLLVIDRLGNTATTSTSTITVADPELHAWTETICVSVDNIFDGAPAGSTNVTSMTALNTALENLADANSRVLFRRGEVFEDVAFRLGDTRQACYWSSFGPLTEKPILFPPLKNFSDFSFGGPNGYFQITALPSTGTVIFTDLEFQADWDVTSETGCIGVGVCIDVRDTKATSQMLLVHGCTFDKVNAPFVSASNKNTFDTDNRYMFANNIVKSWRNYGLNVGNAPGDLFAVIGNRITQDPDAQNGGNGDKRESFFNWHAPVRLPDMTGQYVAMNDIFSRHGWSGDDQHCIRLVTSALPNQWTIVNRNVLEGGYLVISLEGQNTGELDIAGNHLVDNNLAILTSATTGAFVASERGGTHIRNNYVYASQAPNASGYGSLPPRAMKTIGNNVPAGDENAPMRGYNNTKYWLRTTDGANGVMTIYDPGEVFTNSEGLDNILYAPDTQKPTKYIEDEPLDVTGTIPGVTLRYKGVRQGFLPIFVEVNTEIPDGETLSVPYSAFHQTLAKCGGKGSTDLGGPTDQAYWLEVEAAGDTRHTMNGGSIEGYSCAHLGHFEVSFADPVNMVFTNRTGRPWTVDEYGIKMHRTSKTPAMDTTYSHAGQSVPYPVPTAGSAALGSSSGEFAALLQFLDPAQLKTGPLNRGAF